MISNGNSFSNGDSMSSGPADASAYPEPWFIRMLGPVQPGAV